MALALPGSTAASRPCERSWSSRRRPRRSPSPVSVSASYRQTPRWSFITWPRKSASAGGNPAGIALAW